MPNRLQIDHKHPQTHVPDRPKIFDRPYLSWNWKLPAIVCHGFSWCIWISLRWSSLKQLEAAWQQPCTLSAETAQVISATLSYTAITPMATPETESWWVLHSAFYTRCYSAFVYVYFCNILWHLAAGSCTFFSPAAPPSWVVSFQLASARGWVDAAAARWTWPGVKLTRKLSKTKQSQFPRKARAECQSVKDVCHRSILRCKECIRWLWAEQSPSLECMSNENDPHDPPHMFQKLRTS